MKAAKPHSTKQHGIRNAGPPIKPTLLTKLNNCKTDEICTLTKKLTLVDKPKSTKGSGSKYHGHSPINSNHFSKRLTIESTSSATKVLRSGSKDAFSRQSSASKSKCKVNLFLNMELGHEDARVTLPISKLTTPSHKEIFNQTIRNDEKPALADSAQKEHQNDTPRCHSIDEHQNDPSSAQKIPSSPIGKKLASPFRFYVDTASQLPSNSDFATMVSIQSPLGTETNQPDIPKKRHERRIETVGGKPATLTHHKAEQRHTTTASLKSVNTSLSLSNMTQSKATSPKNFKQIYGLISPTNRLLKQKTAQPGPTNNNLRMTSTHNASQARKNKSFDQFPNAVTIKRYVTPLQQQQMPLQEKIFNILLSNGLSPTTREQTSFLETTNFEKASSISLLRHVRSVDNRFEETATNPLEQHRLTHERVATCENLTSFQAQNVDLLNLTAGSLEKENRETLKKPQLKSEATLSTRSTSNLRETRKPLQFIKNFFLSSKYKYEKCQCDAENLEDVANPTCRRAEKWLLAKYQPSELEYLKSVYDEILKDENLDEDCVKQIEKDLQRTFPDNPYFSKEGEGLPILERVLNVFAKYDPAVGYVQGMNFLAAALLMHSEEYIAFWLLALLFEKLEMRDVFLPELPGLSKHSKIIDILLSIHYPDLYEKFQEIDIKVGVYCSEWILSLFTTVIPPSIMGMFFDKLFDQGWPFFYKIALAILSKLRSKILKENDFSAVISLLKSQSQSARKPEAKSFRLNWIEIFNDAVSMEIDSKFVHTLQTNFDLDNKEFRASFMETIQIAV